MQRIYLPLLYSLGAFILIWDIFLFISPTKDTVFNYLFNIGYGLLFLTGAVIGLSSAFKYKEDQDIRNALIYISFGLLLHFIGLVIWGLYNLVFHVEVPYPSFADVFLLLFVPFLGIGLLYLLQDYKSYIKINVVIESAAVLLTSSLLMIILISLPEISQEIPLMTRLFNLAYPLSDALLITIAYMIFRISGGKIKTSIILFIFGILFTAIGDIVFDLQTTNGTYWNGGAADLFFAASGFILSLAVIKTVQSFKTIS